MTVIVTSHWYRIQEIREATCDYDPFIVLRNKLNRKAGRRVKVKALAFWQNGIKIIQEEGKRLVKAIVLPIRGYNKTAHLVIIKPFDPIQKFACFKYNLKTRRIKRECQGFRVYGFCSHILAVLYKKTGSSGLPAEEYFSLKKEAENFRRRWTKNESPAEIWR